MVVDALIIAAVALSIYQLGAFIGGSILRDNSIMDVLYGPAFLTIALITLVSLRAYEPAALAVTALVAAWALRLGVRIARKNWGKPEDPRYARWREQWMQRGAWYFYMRSFVQIYLLQGVIIYVVSLPVLLVIAQNSALTAAAYLGIGVWLIGFVYESLADWQLDRFIADPDRTGLMTDGLFRFSRRPNYFGESLQWWGLALIALSQLPAWPWGVLAFISPVTITYIVTRVTGPMTEAQFEGRTGWDRYTQCVNYFVPGPPACDPDD
jgi:steroid 5-alpha reductase family enzyme